MEAFDKKPVTPWPLWLCVVIQTSVLFAIGGGVLFALGLVVGTTLQLV